MDNQNIAEDCTQLIKSCKTLSLATVNKHGSHSSYTPFVFLDGRFYILVSGLAEHTNNLINAHTKIGCMLIADELDSVQIFARKRIMFKAMPKQLDRESEQWSVIMNNFKLRFGDIIELLDSLPDFTLFELKPEHAVLVKGFGDAHQLSDIFS